jgi:hypothetical protein
MVQELYLAFREECRASPVWVEGAGHNNIESLLHADGRFWDIINQFLVENCCSSGSPKRKGKGGAVQSTAVMEVAPTFGHIFSGRGNPSKAAAQY